MPVSQMLADFSAKESLPIDVRDVIAEIRKRGVKDDIQFFQDIDLDTRVIRGFLKREQFEKDGKRRFLSTITYGKLDPETERLVCGKELLHILDPESHKAQDHGQVKDLIAKISLPAELVDPFDGDQAWNDRIAIHEAIAIMFPLGARKILYDGYVSGKLSLAWIAQQAELPVGYVAYAMNGYWPNIVNTLIARRVRIEDAATRTVRPVAAKPTRRRGTR